MSRIAELRAQLSGLKHQLATSEGMLINRDSLQALTLEKKNQELKAEMIILEKALYGLLLDSRKPRDTADEKRYFEVIRQAAVEFCEKSNVEPELWKNLRS